MKSGELVHRAARYILDPDVPQAEGGELGAHGRPQIDPCFVPRPARHDRSASGCARDGLGNASVDLEAARPDARADGREHDVTAEVRHGCVDDPGHDSAPPGVDGDDVSAHRIGNEDWNAVGHAHADCGGMDGSPRHDRVGLGFRARLRGFAHFDRATAVHLFHLDDARYSQRVRHRVGLRASFGEPMTESRVVQQCGSQDGHQPP